MGFWKKLIGVITSADKEFTSVKIDKQEWMTENLNLVKFRNGDLIPKAKTAMEWKKAIDYKKPAWCFYENDSANGRVFGKLYNWHAVNDPRGLAPDGWHVPSDDEWRVLTEFLGGKEIYGKFYDGKQYWYTPSAGGKMLNSQFWGEATNSSGFSGLPGGTRSCFLSFSFNKIRAFGYYWSSTEYKETFAWIRSLQSFEGNVDRDFRPQGEGLSVRCLRD